MHKVGVAIDAGHAALGEHGVQFTAGIALRPDRARIVTLAAGDTVPGPEIGESFLFEPGASCLPDFRIAEIVRQFNEHIAHAGRDMDVGLDEPVSRRDVTVAATWPHALSITAMLRVLVILISVLQLHSVTRCAKRISRGCMVDRETSHHATSTDDSCDEQKCDQEPAADCHRDASKRAGLRVNVM